MTTKTKISWPTVEDYSLEIIRQISSSRWQPDYVVGITRGGLVPAMLISQWFDCPMHTLSVRLRDGEEDCETNCWMAEDAFGHASEPKNILIVDDINDSGATLNWIISDWRSSCLPNDSRWDSVWNNNVRFATLCDKMTSDFIYNVDYTAREISSDDSDVWWVFPWENWWN